MFSIDAISDAIMRVYERYADQLPAGAGRAHAEAIARSVAVVLEPPSPESIGAVLALDIQYVDHRALGWGTARGTVAFVRGLRTVREAASGIEMRTDELLALRADALLVRRTVTGVRTDGGGIYRRRPVVLWVFGANGRVAHWEQFDGDQREKAIARFEELATPAAPARLVENAATRSLDRSEQAEVLATRGGRLALARVRFERPVVVCEVDGGGNRVATVRFDPDALDAAYAELDARYAAGEAAEHAGMWATLARLRRALAERDWNQLTSSFSPELVAEDHRLLGWGTVRSPEQYLTAVRPLSELRPDVTLRVDHMMLAERAVLFASTWTGSEATGVFEIPGVTVFAAGHDGRIARVHHYSLEQLDAARARFAELCAEQTQGR